MFSKMFTYWIPFNFDNVGEQALNVFHKTFCLSVKAGKVCGWDVVYPAEAVL